MRALGTEVVVGGGKEKWVGWGKGVPSSVDRDAGDLFLFDRHGHDQGHNHDREHNRMQPHYLI